ncbi:spore germination protein [Petroclostridium sp. X23]|uniref:spore germination protein n=1 Tax=Petroclostridium sp. X23 TaxID=3045146 RepID=UPI0024AE1D94|nr:spore germination protein [Petroclostridium sp. X23]WHH60216.1 spore germination protein [Petroclostridium sp. X23]
MFKRIKNQIKYMNYLQQSQKSKNKKERYVDDECIIYKKIEANLSSLKKILGASNDIVFREFNIGKSKPTKAFICFVDGMVDKNTINQNILKSLTLEAANTYYDNKDKPTNLFMTVKESILSAAEVSETTSFNDVLDGIMSGATPLFIDGYDRALIIGLREWPSRGVEEPDTEATVRGPREGFTETLRTNTTLLRRKIKTPNFIIESFKLGKQTHTDVCIAYMNGIADLKIVEEVRRRLNRIDTDSILESGYIEQFIEDNPFSLVATVGNSEKPDRVAAKLLEGRVAILCDGTPFVLTVPCLFVEAIQATEDYYARPYLSSLLRILRLGAVFVTLMTPAVYVALATFHQEMIPTVLLITAAAAREGIPFPAFIEALLMGVVFEMLRESGVRMPRPIGQAVSIVGALVIGEAAVQAGIASAPVVIIAAITGISSFIVPALIDSIIYFRLFLLILSASFGLYGIVVGMMVILAHLCSLRSFGVPYLTPFAPTVWKDLKDSFIRAPLWLMQWRPKLITREKSIRQEADARPKKPDSDKGGGYS